MGREIHRVPLDFDWPLDKPWEGFINPHYRPCPKAQTNECHGGYSSAGKWLDAIVRFLALIGSQAVEEPNADRMRARGMIFPHPYLENFQQAPRTTIPSDALLKIQEEPDQHKRFRMLSDYYQQNPPQLLPFTEELAGFFTGLAGGVRPHPVNNGGWEIQKTLMRAAGIDPEGKWGQCTTCDGHGIDPEVYEAYDTWERESVPRGEGWQLWETVSEGAPITPVFPTAEGLIDYMSQPCAKSAEEGRGPYPDMPWAQGYKRAHAEAFVRGPGWAPSMIVADGRLMTGVEAAAGLPLSKSK